MALLDRYKFAVREQDLSPAFRYRIGRFFIRPFCVILLLTFPLYWTVALWIDARRDMRDVIGTLLSIVIYGIKAADDESEEGDGDND